MTRREEKKNAECVALTKTEAKEKRQESSSAVLSRPSLFSPHSVRCPRHAPWLSLVRGASSSLPLSRAGKEREKGRIPAPSPLSPSLCSCGGLSPSVSLLVHLSHAPPPYPVPSRSRCTLYLNRTASAAAAASRPALPVRRARAPIAAAHASVFRQSGLASSSPMNSEYFSLPLWERGFPSRSVYHVGSDAVYP